MCEEYIDEFLKINREDKIEKLYKEIKIKTEFIEKLLYLILNSNDNKLQKEVYEIGITYDKNIQELKEVIEYIEENKIPEKLNKQHFHKKQRQLANKINEIIDYLENKGE